MAVVKRELAVDDNSHDINVCVGDDLVFSTIVSYTTRRNLMNNDGEGSGSFCRGASGRSRISVLGCLI